MCNLYSVTKGQQGRAPNGLFQASQRLGPVFVEGLAAHSFAFGVPRSVVATSRTSLHGIHVPLHRMQARTNK